MKWLSGARAQDKNKQYYCHFLFFFWFLLSYAIQGKSITWLVNSTLNCTWKPISHSSLCDSCDIGFRVQFNMEFPRQVMNFPIEFSIVWGRLNFSRWPFYSCRVFRSNSTFFQMEFNSLPFTTQVRLFFVQKGNLKFSDSKMWWTYRRIRKMLTSAIRLIAFKILGKLYWGPCRFKMPQVPLGWPNRQKNFIAPLRMQFQRSIQSTLGVYRCVKTCEVFLGFLATIFPWLYFVDFSVASRIHCFRSIIVSFTGFYTKARMSPRYPKKRFQSI